MLKPLQYTLILIFLTLLSSCDECQNKTSTWKYDAQQNLVTLQAAVEELQQFDSILQYEKSKNNGLTIWGNETDKLENKYKIKLPKTKLWFEKATRYYVGMNYIQIKNENVKASVGECSYGSEIYSAYLYQSTTGVMPSFPKPFALASDIIDTVALGNNWNFVLLWCDGCTAD